MSGATTEQAQRLDLVQTLVARLRLPWYGSVGVIATMLAAALGAATLVDYRGTEGFDWTAWRMTLQIPSIIVYILAMYPIVLKTKDRATGALRRMVPVDKASTDALIRRLAWPSRGLEMTYALVGAALAIVLAQPWRGTVGWFNLYLMGTQTLMFSLLAMLIYHGVRGARYLARLTRNMALDIFDLDALTSVARWSLTVSLIFIGGIALSIVFQTIENLLQWQVAAVYAVLVGTTILIFFMSMWSTHSAIVAAKRRELALVTDSLNNAWRRMKEQVLGSPAEASGIIYSEVAAWGAYERRVKEVREWPLSSSILGRLAISVVSPIVVYSVRLLLGWRGGF